MVRVCLNSNNVMGATLKTWLTIIRPPTGTGVCPIAMQQRSYWCVYLQINSCHSSQGVFPAVTKYFNQTCPGDKPEKQGVVRNQLAAPDRKQPKDIHTSSTPQTFPFRREPRNQNWSLLTLTGSERRTSRTRRISPPQSLARSATPPHRPLLVVELAWSHWDRGLLLE